MRSAASCRLFVKIAPRVSVGDLECQVVAPIHFGTMLDLPNLSAITATHQFTPLISA
jgi:hypothetical protein